MSIDSKMRLADGEHVVQFYERDDDLVDVVVGYLSAAVAGGDAVVVLATPGHCAAFAAALAGAGVDVGAATAGGQLIVLDAADTLARFMVDGVPDAAAFDAVVGDVVRHAGASGRPVRAYGEMVALLWEAGNETGAVRLEQLWNGLGEQLPFALFCAYPSHLFGGASPDGALADVCELHSDVVARAPAPQEAEVTRRYSASLDAPGLARRFVADTLRGWGRDELVDDGMLVVTELATNAVIHAVSDFTVGLSRAGAGSDCVHVVVGDASQAVPAERQGEPGALNGRGWRLVREVARRSGFDVVSRGKFVWAELSADGSAGARDERSA
jgi:anti-sigma regulatory factor (Ser/Thr protein kinase)